MARKERAETERETGREAEIERRTEMENWERDEINFWFLLGFCSYWFLGKISLKLALGWDFGGIDYMNLYWALEVLLILGDGFWCASRMGLQVWVLSFWVWFSVVLVEMGILLWLMIGLSWSSSLDVSLGVAIWFAWLVVADCVGWLSGDLFNFFFFFSRFNCKIKLICYVYNK